MSVHAAAALVKVGDKSQVGILKPLIMGLKDGEISLT